MRLQQGLVRGSLGLTIFFVISGGAGAKGKAQDILVQNTAELVAAMNPANAGKTIRINAGTYCPSGPLTLPEGSRILGAGEMEYEDGFPAGFREGTATEIVPADGGIRCPAELGKFAGNSVITLTDGSRLQGIKISIDLSAGYTFAGNTVIAHAKGGQTIRTLVSECDIQARSGPPSIVPPGIPAGRAIQLMTGDGPPNHDLPGDPSIQAVISRSVIRGNNTVALFTGQWESKGRIFLALQGNVVEEANWTLDLVGGISRIAAGVSIVTEDTTTEVLSIRNLYQGVGATSTGWLLTAGANGPPPGSPSSNRNNLTLTSLSDRIENVGVGVNARAALRRSPNHGYVNDNTTDLQMIGTAISSLTTQDPNSFTADLIFCPVAGQGSATKFDKAGDGNWIYTSAIGLNGSGTRDNLYEYLAGICGHMDSTGDDNGMTFWGNARLWEVMNKNIDPDPPAELFSF
ncbi:MAG TPA: hypothetical protein VJR29_09995 [bacterium]|nr:hypothetical protein [bacterium]